MISQRTLSIGFVLTTLIAGTAQGSEAGDHVARQLTPWQGGVVQRGADNAGYCAIEAQFDNGITLAIAEARSSEITVAMQLTGLTDTQPGTMWPVTIVTDGRKKKGLAQVVEVTDSGDLIAMPYGGVAEFGDVSAISIITPHDHADFGSQSLPKALRALRACVRQMGAEAKDGKKDPR